MTSTIRDNMSAFEVLRQLHDDCLYEDLELLSTLVICVDKNCDDVFTPPQRYQALVWYGDALKETRQFRKAELTYEQALQWKRSSVRKRQQDTVPDITPQIEVQFKIFQCLKARCEYKLAIAALESIPLKQRSPKIHMALGRVFQNQGNDRGAASCYREVIKSNPYALAAINALLELNVKVGDASSALTSKGVHVTMEWLPAYISAHGELYARNVPKALESFEALEESLQLKGNFDVNVMVGKLHHFQGESAKSIAAFERAVKSDKYQLRGLDTYAAVLHKEKKVKDLEQLSNHALTLSDSHPDTWVILGYLFLHRLKQLRAKHMCDKALDLNPRHVEAILLKADIMNANGSVQLAINSFNDAHAVAPHRFEPYRGQVTCYLTQNRFADAQTAATNACRQLGHTPRTLTLKAEVLVKNSQLDKAKTYLEKVLAHDPAYLPAIYALAEIHESTRNYTAGVQLLQEKLQLVGSKLRIHQMYGDFLHKLNEPEQALFHYGIALNLDPTNVQVKKGIQLVEQSVGGEQSYEMEMEDDHESDANNEDSDVEGVWSDEF